MPAEVTLVSHDKAPRKGTPCGFLVITIREGRNRQVRRMCEAVGHPVQKLRRVRIGPISDRRLRPGEWRELTLAEVKKLKVESRK